MGVMWAAEARGSSGECETTGFVFCGSTQLRGKWINKMLSGRGPRLYRRSMTDVCHGTLHD
jgi:hypothetical protein